VKHPHPKAEDWHIPPRVSAPIRAALITLLVHAAQTDHEELANLKRIVPLLGRKTKFT
jgi:hypothetical protein